MLNPTPMEDLGTFIINENQEEINRMSGIEK